MGRGRVHRFEPPSPPLPPPDRRRNGTGTGRCRLAVAEPARGERPALKLAPLENRLALLDEGAGRLLVVGGLAAVDVVGRLEV